MAWKIGAWRAYDEGQVHKVLKNCVDILLDRGMTVSASMGREERKLEHGEGLYEMLLSYEKEHRVGDLLEVLAQGPHIACTRNGVSAIDIMVQLRVPSDSEENRKLFKDIVVTWVDKNSLTFTERFFRLPKLTEDIVDRYLDNPLEKSLTRMFGFHFTYRVIIESKNSLPDLSELRKTLYRVLREPSRKVELDLMTLKFLMFP